MPASKVSPASAEPSGTSFFGRITRGLGGSITRLFASITNGSCDTVRTPGIPDLKILDNNLVTSTTGNYDLAGILQFSDNIYDLLLCILDILQTDRTHKLHVLFDHRCQTG